MSQGCCMNFWGKVVWGSTTRIDSARVIKASTDSGIRNNRLNVTEKYLRHRDIPSWTLDLGHPKKAAKRAEFWNSFVKGRRKQKHACTFMIHDANWSRLSYYQNRKGQKMNLLFWRIQFAFWTRGVVVGRCIWRNIETLPSPWPLASGHAFIKQQATPKVWMPCDLIRQIRRILRVTSHTMESHTAEYHRTLQDLS